MCARGGRWHAVPPVDGTALQKRRMRRHLRSVCVRPLPHHDDVLKRIHFVRRRALRAKGVLVAGWSYGLFTPRCGGWAGTLALRRRHIICQKPTTCTTPIHLHINCLLLTHPRTLCTGVPLCRRRRIACTSIHCICIYRTSVSHKRTCIFNCANGWSFGWKWAGSSVVLQTHVARDQYIANMNWIGCSPIFVHI